jgi:hypothetical protein
MRSIFSLLSLFVTAIIADPVCIDAILSTIPYSAALTTHDGGCPTATPEAYDLAANNAGCCHSDLRIKTLGSKGAACCPCGAECTGFFPNLLDWTEEAGTCFPLCEFCSDLKKVFCKLLQRPRPPQPMLFMAHLQFCCRLMQTQVFQIMASKDEDDRFCAN